MIATDHTKTSLPFVSVITICFNDPAGVLRTIQSVISQKYDNFEYILIDGGSDKETLDLILQYSENYAYFASEPDNGVYDAMNKGILHAKGEWYIMMNAGDIFASSTALFDNLNMISQFNHIIWAGGGSKILTNTGTERYYFANREKHLFHHQSLFIKKELHLKYGMYINNQHSQAWDYFFFCLIQNEPFLETGLLVAICDGGGRSSSVANYLHVCAIDFIFGNKSRLTLALYLLLYPLYRILFKCASMVIININKFKKFHSVFSFNLH